MSVDIMSVDIMSVDIMSVDIMSVDIMSVDIMSVVLRIWIQIYRLHVSLPLEDGFEDAAFALAEPEGLGEAVVVDVATLFFLDKKESTSLNLSPALKTKLGLRSYIQNLTKARQISME
jgi:hypothetical protein